ncbi:MAG: hypothetical protein RLZZ117_1248 [Cyanobacteriota bacterium]
MADGASGRPGGSAGRRASTPWNGAERRGTARVGRAENENKYVANKDDLVINYLAVFCLAVAARGVAEPVPTPWFCKTLLALTGIT